MIRYLFAVVSMASDSNLDTIVNLVIAFTGCYQGSLNYFVPKNYRFMTFGSSAIVNCNDSDKTPLQLTRMVCAIARFIHP